MGEYKIPDTSTLRRIRALSELSKDQLIALANQLQVFSAEKGDVLIERGSTVEFSLYLVSGSVSLLAKDGHVKKISVRENDVLTPIAQLRPSVYDVLADGPLEYLKIHKQKLVEFAQLSEGVSGDISVHSLQSEGDEYAQSLIHDLFRNIMRDEVKIPALPAVATRINNAYRNEDTQLEELVTIFEEVPAVHRRFLSRTVRDKPESPEYREELTRVTRSLGRDSVYYMTMSYLMYKLFDRAKSILKQGMIDYQEHSLNVAATARVLAKGVTKFHPDRVMLAGMSHCVGNILTLGYLAQHSNFAFDAYEFDYAVNSVRPEFSSLLLRRWKLDEEITNAAVECDDWFRNQGEEIDLSDLVLVANYHCLIRTERASSLPPISVIPAMKKFNIDQEKSVSILSEAIAEKNKVQKLLR